MDNQQINVKAAKLLGNLVMEHDKCESCSIAIHNNTTRLFNVFTNPQDLIDMVKFLGERGIYFRFIAPKDKRGWVIEYIQEDFMNYTYFSSYEMAVGAAIKDYVEEQNPSEST